MTATWSDPSAQIAADYPARASSVRQIQENIIALAEGASGAPAITRAALVPLGYAAVGGGSADQAVTHTITNYSETKVLDFTVSSGIITVPRTGTYRITLRYDVTAPDTSFIPVALQRNGSDIAMLTENHTVDRQITIPWIIDLTAGDTLRVRTARPGGTGSVLRVMVVVEEM